MEQLLMFEAPMPPAPRPVRAVAPVIEKPTSKPERLFPLRDYQVEAVNAILTRYAEGVRRPLLVLPTGTGKTVVLSDLIRERLPEHALILAHREELIQQAADKFQMVTPGVSVGTVKAERNELGHPVTVASVQTLVNPKRLAQLRDAGGFGTIVVDEAHHAVSQSYRTILDGLGAFEDGGPLTLGVTATPDRGDKVGLGNVFQEIVYEAKLLDMIAKGYLCDIKAVRVTIPVDFDKVRITYGDDGEVLSREKAIRTTAGDYNAGDVEHAFDEAKAEEIIASALGEHIEGRNKIIAFVVSVASAYRLADALNRVGISADVVEGQMPTEQRRAVLARFERGNIRVLVNVAALTEGFDSPGVDAILMARPTKSRALYTQCIGRGTRIAPGKKDVLVIDVVGNSATHKLQTIADLTGLPLGKPKETTPRDVFSLAHLTQDAPERVHTDAESLLSLLRAYGAVVDGDGHSVAEQVDLFDNSWAKWMPMQGRWVLPVPQGTYLLVPRDGGLWDVLSKREKEHPQLIAGGLDLGYAQGLAEARAKNVAHALVDRNASWRSGDVTDPQRNMLRGLGLNPNDYATRGAASDAISAAKVAKDLQLAGFGS